MQRNPIAKFRIHASQPCLYRSRRIVLAQSARQLKSKSQTGLGITVDVAAKRSIDALWKEIGEVLNNVSQEECTNLFSSCGYVCT
jgi:hypothetical protein